jgi:hypothetical protein
MDGVAHIMLGLTAIERWGGTRRIEPRFAPQHWFVLVGVVVLLVLLVLLVAISYRRYQQSRSKEPKAETFADNAQRRGLSVRERQILLAIAMRSGLPHTHAVFHEIDALNRGMAQLLAECAQTRTPQEIDDLKAEISRLRLKLGFDKAHGSEVHFVNRRRFLRVAVRSPALIAHLPFVRSDWATGETTAQGTDAPPGAQANPRAGYAPVFVESMVTELAGPGLRIETPLQVQVDDQVLVVFRLAEGIGDGQTRVHTVAAVGRVKHGRDIERGAAIPDAIDRVWEGSLQRDFRAVAAQPLSVAVELTGLSNEEIEALASITNGLFSRTQDGRDDGAAAARVAHPRDDGNIVSPAASGVERDE